MNKILILQSINILFNIKYILYMKKYKRALASFSFLHNFNIVSLTIFAYFHYTRTIPDSIFFFDRYTHLSWRRDITPFLLHTTHVLVRGERWEHKERYTYVCTVHTCTHKYTYVRICTHVRPSPSSSPWKRKITGNAKSIAAIHGISWM